MKKVKQIIGLNTITQPVNSASPSKEEAAAVDSSYLARQAGLQTVKTSARGILKTNENAPVRKKLLGE